MRTVFHLTPDLNTITMEQGKGHQRDAALESFGAAPAELLETL